MIWRAAPLQSEFALPLSLRKQRTRQNTFEQRETQDEGAVAERAACNNYEKSDAIRNWTQQQRRRPTEQILEAPWPYLLGMRGTLKERCAGAFASSAGLAMRSIKSQPRTTSKLVEYNRGARGQVGPLQSGTREKPKWPRSHAGRGDNCRRERSEHPECALRLCRAATLEGPARSWDPE